MLVTTEQTSYDLRHLGNDRYLLLRKGKREVVRIDYITVGRRMMVTPVNRYMQAFVTSAVQSIDNGQGGLF